MKIYITKDFKGDYITREAGERLRTMILKVTEGGENAEIDFGHVMIASTSFLDEGLAKLALHGWTKKRLDSKVFLKNIHPKDLAVLKRLCDDRGMK